LFDPKKDIFVNTDKALDYSERAALIMPDRAWGKNDFSTYATFNSAPE
jgi:hypothetical protein